MRPKQDLVKSIELCDLLGRVGSLSASDFRERWPYPVLVELPPGVTLVRGASLNRHLLQAANYAEAVRIHPLVEECSPLVAGQCGDVRLRACKGMVAEHAEFTGEGGRWRLHDLDGRARTKVSGRVVPSRPVPLRNGQAISMGEGELLFLEPAGLYRLALEALSSEEAPLELPRSGAPLQSLIKSDHLSGVGPESGPFLLQVATEGEEADLDGGQTFLLERQDADGRKDLGSSRVYRLVRGSELSVGRDSERDIVLDERSVSRLHARLWPHAGGCRLADMGSQNGTWAGSEGLKAGLVRELRMGESVRFGRSLCMFLDWSMLRDLSQRLKSVA